MAEAVYLPKIGMIMEGAVLTRWLAPDGGTVSRGDAIFEMDVEKVVQNVEAEADGTLRHLVGDCIRLRPGAIVACLLAAGEDVPQGLHGQVASQWSEPAEEFREAGSEPSVPAEVAAAPSAPATLATSAAHAAPLVVPPGDRIVASPFARRLAAQLGVDLATVQGSGPRGRITEADIRAFAEGPAANRTDVPPEAASLEPVLSDAVQVSDAAGASSDGVETIPYAGRRRAIGERMVKSLRDSAQLTLTSEIRVDSAVRMSGSLSREWRSDRTVVTLTTLMIRAVACALLEHPRLNSRLDGAQIIENQAINIGFAVDSAEGLMVPVIRAAAARSLQDVAADFIALTRKADVNKLTPADVTGATFTVTSLQGFEVDAFTPILNPPQAAILGLGRVRRLPVAGDDGVEIGQVTTLSLTVDHRVTDGAPAARFLARVAQFLERPDLLI